MKKNQLEKDLKKRLELVYQTRNSGLKTKITSWKENQNKLRSSISNHPMLKDKTKNEHKKQPKSIYQTHDSGHETAIIL